MARQYVIITNEDVSSVDFSQVQETSADTLRWNKDNTKTFVKYEGYKPKFLYGKTAYSYNQILFTVWIKYCEIIHLSNYIPAISKIYINFWIRSMHITNFGTSRN